MSQSQTPTQSHTSLTQCPLQGWQLKAQQAGQYKITKFLVLASTHRPTFYPITIETAGTWDDVAIEIVQEMGSRTTFITQDTSETVFLFQRLSIALQRGNAVSFLNTINTE